jgi:hypothetical protein
MHSLYWLSQWWCLMGVCLECLSEWSVLRCWEALIIINPLPHWWWISSPYHCIWVLVLYPLIWDCWISQILIKTSQTVLHIYTLASFSYLMLIMCVIFNFNSKIFLSFNEWVRITIYLRSYNLSGLLPVFAILVMSFFKSSPSISWHLSILNWCLECIHELRVI